MSGFFEGASRGLDRGVGLGTQLYKDAMAEKQLARQAEREARMDQMAESDRVNKDYQFEQEMALKRQALAQKPQATPVALTPGQKAADMAYGRSYQDWVGGKQSGLEQGLSALEAAQKRIYGAEYGKPDAKPRQDLSGKSGYVPDMLKPLIVPEVAAIKSDVRSAVTQTLRATLGAAFTEGEGDRVFAMAWDDKMPIEENIQRLNRVMQQYKTQYGEESAKARYFEENGTLAGFKYGGGESSPGHPQDAPAQVPQQKRYQILSVE